jgi:hypothetical protein
MADTDRVPHSERNMTRVILGVRPLAEAIYRLSIGNITGVGATQHFVGFAASKSLCFFP